MLMQATRAVQNSFVTSGRHGTTDQKCTVSEGCTLQSSTKLGSASSGWRLHKNSSILGCPTHKISQWDCRPWSYTAAKPSAAGAHASRAFVTEMMCSKVPACMHQVGKGSCQCLGRRYQPASHTYGQENLTSLAGGRKQSLTEALPQAPASCVLVCHTSDAGSTQAPDTPKAGRPYIHSATFSLELGEQQVVWDSNSFTQKRPCSSCTHARLHSHLHVDSRDVGDGKNHAADSLSLMLMA